MREPRDRNQWPWRGWLWALILAALLSGCAGLGKYREPVRVSVSNIQIIEATVLEQLYAVTLRIQNANAYPFTVRGGSFDLEINGRDFGHGVTDNAVTVPPFGDAKVEVRMVSTLFGMLRLVQGFQERERESLDYRISGRLQLDEVYGGIGFSESGELSLPRGGGAAPGGTKPL
jgi:LEA14-like dessication related protein